MAWTLRFSDAFTDTDYTSLPSHNAAWTNHAFTNRIATGGTTVGSVSDARSSISTVLADKQAAELAWLAGGGGTGPLIRFANAGAGFWDWTGYWLYYASGSCTLYRGQNDGGGDNLGSRSVTLSSGDVLRLEADGTSLTIWVNGVQQGAAIVDVEYASGRAGLYKEGSVDGYGDDFAAYDDAGSAGNRRRRFFMGAA